MQYYAALESLGRPPRRDTVIQLQSGKKSSDPFGPGPGVSNSFRSVTPTCRAPRILFRQHRPTRDISLQVAQKVMLETTKGGDMGLSYGGTSKMGGFPCWFPLMLPPRKGDRLKRDAHT